MSFKDLFKKKENIIPQTSVASEQTNPIEEKTENTAAEGEIRRVFNLIILDESGSMMNIYAPALTGVNETLQTIRNAQKDHENQRHFVSLIAFDSGHYNEIYRNTPAEKAVDITTKQYRPDGCTPLYDAMGRAINELRPLVSEEDVVLVTVITDGYENASREYGLAAIKALVEEMKSKGWVFTYIGANQDVLAVATSLGIDNHLEFETNDDATHDMFIKECRSRKAFFSRVANCSSVKELNENADYFV